MSMQPSLARTAVGRLARFSVSAAALALLQRPAWPQAIAARPQYPETKTIEQVDDYHGTKVADPYRWLETTSDPETKKWIEAQNRVTESWLAAVPARAQIHARLEKLWNYERVGVIGKVNGVLFLSRNTGLMAQNQFEMQRPSDPKPVLVLDPNKLSADGTVSVQGFSPSEDARYVAYSTSDGGSDWHPWRVRNLTTLKDLPDRLEWCKFSGAAWTHDNAGFFYGRYSPPSQGEALKAANYDQKLAYHKLGDAQEKDALVYERPDHKDWMFSPEVTDDGRYLVISIHVGTDRRNRVYYKDLARADAPVIPLLDDFDASYSFFANRGDVFYFRTDLDAPRGRVIAIDLGKPQRGAWREAVPAADDSLTSATMLNGELVLSYLHDASSRVRIVKLDGSLDRELELPGIGSAGGFTGRNDDTETWYSFSSFTTPPSVQHYDFKTGESKLFFRPQIDFDAAGYETRLVFAKSKDGTRVPIHVTARKGIALDGSHACYLYGYGGFNIAMTPRFSPALLVWLERGGIYAQAVLRGGSEYGEQWHEAGMLANKQNVFDDFIGAAEHLVAAGYTNSKRLAIDGGSNGGLLVGACLTQRPDLFGAAVPEVGVLDMLRYHKFTIGWAWASEYGSADDPQQFSWLYRYSPLHNLKPGTKYPPTLILTGDHDDRVVPGHSFKFAATMQKAQAGDAPVLIRIETRAGHGAGKPTQYQIDERADVFAFLEQALGIKASS